MENDDSNDNGNEAEYAFNGKMLLICSVILFIAVIIMLSVHAYFRLYFLPARHRQLLRRIRSRSRRNRRSLPFFYIDPTLTAVSRGLKASVITSLPVFTFSKNNDPIECAVCLSEFEDGETGRVLPKCKHSFHTECIDMWFVSHSTCPLCRVHVEDSSDGETRAEVVVTLCESETGSSSEEVNQTHVLVRSSSLEPVCDSATTSFRSTLSRKLSFKRNFSKECKEPSDVEQGGEETQ
ncbi:hypothetical protein TanjilG_29113 [Lupinus angustifolius]|uniref:RING-type E3 ubiquitin transferase n=1 Tax=Lupinus angustifolius TaxID=3871 RepID=A0A1J7HI60_LUPAN|nr:PREDICTED: RING-H2 finger protein ATL2-like [Lupinus angustifolius]OIW00123.1 hypothetical protein TanjilG_29113 [Lupinus angustifolius]